MPYSNGEIKTDSTTGESIVFRDGYWYPNSPSGKIPDPPSEGGGAFGTKDSFGEVGTDVAKSIVPSLTRGTIGALTAPASMVDLAAKGLSWGGKKVGADMFSNALDNFNQRIPIPGTSLEVPPYLLPRYQDVMDLVGKANEHMPEALKADQDKNWYLPKTTIGKVVGGGLEALPSAMMGGGPAGAKAVTGFMTGAGSELAGQQAEGSPWEIPMRVAGGVAGAKTLPLGLKAITPNIIDPDRLKMAKTLEARGTTPSAGQVIGKGFVNNVEGSVINSIGAPENFTPGGQQASVTKALMRSTGSGKDKALLPDVQGQRKALRDEIEQTLPQQHRSILFDQQFDPHNTKTGDVAQVTQTLRRRGGDQQEVQKWIDEFRLGAGGNPAAGTQLAGTTGERYQAVRSDLSGRIAALRKSGDNSTAARLDDLLKATDSWVERQAGSGFKDWREKYANQTAVEKATKVKGSAAASGQIDPSKFFAAHKDKNAPTAEYARSAEALLGAPHPKEVSSHDRNAAALVGSALGLLGARYMPGMHVDPILGAIIGGPAAAVAVKNPATARAVFNPLVQGYLKNQVAAGARQGPYGSMDPRAVIRSLIGAPQNQELVGDK